MIATAIDHDREPKPDETRAIRVTEVAALHYPADGYEYRGLIRSYDATGEVLLEQLLPTRRRPEWLVNVRHAGQGLLHVALQSRPADTRRWGETGQVVLHPLAHLNGQSSAVVERPLRGWDELPLHLRVRLTQAPADERTERTLTAVRPRGRASVNGRETLPHADETGGAAPELEVIAPLTEPEDVLVKDVWNKFLAFQDLLVESFFERLLHEEPDLADRFGDAVDLVGNYFAQLFDAAVRQLQPHTGRVLRESYRGIYPASPDGERSATEWIELLTDLGMQPAHWLTARRVWTWTMAQVPYLEDYDRENLAKGTQSATYRFFTTHILRPAFDWAHHYDAVLTPAVIRQMRRTGDQLAADAQTVGTEFYRMLFQAHPDVVPHFGRTDMDSLAGHLVQTIAFLVRSLDAGRDVNDELGELSRVHARVRVPPEAYAYITGPLLTIMRQQMPNFGDEQARAWPLLLSRVSNVLKQPMIQQQRLLTSAGNFIRQVADELAWEPEAYERRREAIEADIRATGTYTHTYEELAYGAQLAWRNSAKCIGRIAWRNMVVRDLRHVTEPDQIFRECVEHLRMATNGGNVQIVMSVFRPRRPAERWGPRIWNSQYVRYAAYEQPDGSLLGDGANLALTNALIRQGWVPPSQKTAFDCLPLAIEVPGQAPKLYEFAPDDVLRVPIEHPAYPQIGALKMQWCAVPAITNFRMDIGGVDYGCVPFNGWFMETEIARNLWEDGRYGHSLAIARALGLDTSGEQTLWRDRAFLELNTAVLHSFTKAKVTLVDHQTAARQFLTHDEREKRAGRECPAQWSWVVPAAGGSTTPVWHHEMRDFFLSPSYHYAADKWAVVDAEVIIAGEDADFDRSEANRVLILYGSETGTAESYARQTARRLSHHRPRVLALNDYDPAQLGRERFVLVVTSTFGNGEPPANARQFLNRLREQPTGTFPGLSFSVMALGSTIYPHFCAAGVALDRELARVGAHRVVVLHRGDEIRGQADTFRQWLETVARLLGEDLTDGSGPAVPTRPLVRFLNAHPVPETARAARRKQLPGRYAGAGPAGAVEAPVVANRELLKEVIAGSRSTRFIAFDISGTDLTYETGDHVAIYPHNPPDLVRRICDRLGVDPAAWFTTSLVDKAGHPVPGDSAYPQPVTVEQVLTEDFDLALREPVNELIGALCQAATKASEKERLTAWSDRLAGSEQDEAVAALKTYITEQFATVADLLDAFPSVRLPFDQLIDLLPKQKPRLYSISSCSLVHPGQIHVTVGVLHVTTRTGQVRPGLCSNYLARLDPEQGAAVRLAVRPSEVRPPRDPRAPMLLVGPGTGLSPLVGFLQHREVQLRALQTTGEPNGHNGHNGHSPNGPRLPKLLQQKTGQARLYFGCRNLNDYLYQEELETWHETGVLTHLDVAFSRVGEEKIYVQHLISQHSEAIWDVLSQPDCHYYVCGDAKMADDVSEVLMIIAKTAGGLSHAQAVQFFRTMQSEGRFVMDVWGILLNFSQALSDVQGAKYAQGERWLNSVTAVPGGPRNEANQLST